MIWWIVGIIIYFLILLFVWALVYGGYLRRNTMTDFLDGGEKELYCYKCGETLRHFITDGRVACSRCGTLRSIEEVEKMIEDSARAKFEDSLEYYSKG